MVKYLNESDIMNEGFFKKKDKKSEKKEKESNSHSEGAKILNDWVKNKNNPIVKKTINELCKFGESVAKKVVTYLKKYATENGFTKKYPMFVMDDIKYDPVNNFDVQITVYQCGWNDEVIDEWEKNNPGKNWAKSNDTMLSTDWYYDLLSVGEKYTKEIFNTMNTDNKYDLIVGTGDGDEGHIYIDIDVRFSIKKEILKQINSETSTNESVEALDEGFFKKKAEKKEPPKKYAPFVKEEKTKMRSIVRSNLNKYPKLKKAVSFDVDDQNTSDDQFTICYVDLWDYPGFDRSHADIHMDEYEEFTTNVKNEIDKAVKCKIDFYDGDWDDFYITAYSRKPLESTNESVEVLDEGFFKKKAEKKKEKSVQQYKRKYANLTEQEFNKCMSIIKSAANSDKLINELIKFNIKNTYSTFSEYTNFDSDNVCVAMLESYKIYDSDDEDYTKLYNFHDSIKKFKDTILNEFKKLPFKVTCDIMNDDEYEEILLCSRKPLESTNESVEVLDEVFGLSREEKAKKAKNKKKLDDIEFSYDKKFNAFCLTVSGYSVDKLQATLEKKQVALEDAKKEKKEASDRQSKLEAQIKISYLEDVVAKCKAMIKKKTK